jgi:hypothetical protein
MIDSAIARDYGFYMSLLQSAKTYDDIQPAVAKLSANNALNMLNTKYFIINPDGEPYLNRNALGNAWYIESVIAVGNANEEIAYLNRFNPRKEAVIDNKFSEGLPSVTTPQAGDTIYLTGYKANELLYKSVSGSDRVAVFSEIYYPAGWKAYIDGMEKPVIRANYLLRAMMVPEGTHEIRFAFEPASYIAGTKISLASSLIYLFFVAGYLSWTIRKKPKYDDPS